MEKIAVFPGSFDPVTKGHENLILRASAMFDKVIVALGTNSKKNGLFPPELRRYWLEKVTENIANVSVDIYDGLTVDYCRNSGASIIIRGIRTSADFEYESHIAIMNKTMLPELETIFLISAPEFIGINSSLVREVIRNGGNPVPFIPKVVVIPEEYGNSKL